MKKIMVFLFAIALSGSMVLASSLSSAVKSDIRTTKNSVKKAVKTDVQNKVNAKTSVANTKKQEKIAALDKKIENLNKEMTTLKNDKNITETERVLEIKRIQTQIDFYQKQKSALK